MKFNIRLDKLKIISVVLTVILVVLMLFNSAFTSSYYSMSMVQFQNLDNQMLSAAYNQSSNGKGVLVVSDLSHDKGELTNLIYELRKLGYGVYVFDYPSNGFSKGNVPFGIRESDYLAEQFYCALVSFTQLSGISPEDVHIVGYGMGARAVLHASALDLVDAKSITYVAPDINLSGKLQYDILNFTVDTSLDWVGDLAEKTPEHPVNIIYSPIDEVFSPEDAELLSEMLGGSGNVSTDTSFCIHSLFMTSFNVAKAVVSFIADVDNTEYNPQYLLSVRTLSIPVMFALFIAIFLLASGGLHRTGNVKDRGRIKVPQNFFRDKAMMLLASVVIMCIMAFALYLVPIRYPYKDMLHLCLFSSYGITMTLLYKYSNFGGGIGKYMFRKDRTGKYRFILLTMLLICVCVGLMALVSIYNPFAIFMKFDWAVIFTILCAFTFYIDERERNLLSATLKQKFILLGLNYAPLMIGFVIMVLLGVYSSAYKVITMIVMAMMCIATERIIRFVGSSSRMMALYKGFLFTTIIFSQACMFLGV